jgi:cobalt-precorrin 5A hydrolase
MGGDEAMIAAGVGFRRETGCDEIVDLVLRAMGEASLAPQRLARLATAAARAGEPCFLDAAKRLNVEPCGIERKAMQRVAPALHTVSPRVQALYGVGSVAEAAALAAAGEGAELLLPRIASAGATCALARGAGP